MPAPSRTRGSGVLFTLGFLAVFCLALPAIHPTPARAQEKATIYASILVSDNALAGRPVMVSFIRDGAIFFQEETITSEAPSAASVGSQDSPVGTYDVRVEGEGIVTEVKRGVTLAGPKNMTLKFVVRPGQGAHVVEYAAGGLPREEVAQRIAALEAAVAELKGGSAP